MADYLEDSRYGGISYGRRRGFPPVQNYSYDDNIPVRSKYDVTFRWEEVFLQDEENIGLPFVIPYSYTLQVSPDLGAKNPMDLFIPESDGAGNSLLQSIGGLRVDNGYLADNNDGSITLTLSTSEFRSLIHDSPNHRYFWRVIASSKDGALGVGGFPDSFYFRDEVLDQEWTIEEPVSPSRSVAQVLRGRKSTDIKQIEINGNTEGVQFPTNTKWKYDAILKPGENIFYIRAKDIRNNWTPLRQITIDLDSSVPYIHQVWNTFDEFGLLLGVKRIPNESNNDYLERILDVAIKTAGLQYIGVLLGAIRETGARLVENAISVTPYHITADKEPGIYVYVDSIGIYIRSNILKVTKEPSIVNPVLMEASLEKRISDDFSVLVETEDGFEVPKEEYKVNFDRNSIIFTNTRYRSDSIYVSYTYEYLLSWQDYPTVAILRDGINSIRYPDGRRMLKAQVSRFMNGTESSEGLVLSMNKQLSIGVETSLNWSEIFIREMTDTKWRDTFTNSSGNFFGTKWMQYVEELKSVAKSEWGLAVADRTTWDPGYTQEGPQAVIPRQFDPSIGYWVISGTNTVVDPSRARALGYVDPNTGRMIIWRGVERFKSGIGYDDDLSVKVSTIERKEYRQPREVTVVVSNAYSASINRPQLRFKL